MKLSPTRNPTRNIVNVWGLENPPYNSRFWSKWKVFVIPKEKFRLQMLQTPIPHGCWMGEVPRKRDPFRRLINTNQPIFSLMITNLRPIFLAENRKEIPSAKVHRLLVHLNRKQQIIYKVIINCHRIIMKWNSLNLPLFNLSMQKNTWRKCIIGYNKIWGIRE